MKLCNGTRENTSLFVHFFSKRFIPIFEQSSTSILVSSSSLLVACSCTALGRYICLPISLTIFFLKMVHTNFYHSHSTIGSGFVCMCVYVGGHFFIFYTTPFLHNTIAFQPLVYTTTAVLSSDPKVFLTPCLFENTSHSIKGKCNLHVTHVHYGWWQSKDFLHLHEQINNGNNGGQCIHYFRYKDLSVDVNYWNTS